MNKLISKYNMLRTKIICVILYLVTLIVLMSPSSSVFQKVTLVANLGVSILLFVTCILISTKHSVTLFVKMLGIYIVIVSLLCLVIQISHVTIIRTGLVSVIQVISLIVFHKLRTTVNKSSRKKEN